MFTLKKFIPLFLVMLLLITGVTQALAQDQKDIVDTAVADGRFSTLATALTAAGLIDTLKGPGPFTVFAPTDDAFAKLPAGTLNDLLADKEALTKVLTYHVVPGKVMAADVVKLTSAETVAKLPVSISVQGSDVILNGSSKVIITDIPASNGVIHVIDTVLLPPAEPMMAEGSTMAMCSQDYTVQASDSLSQIAAKFLGNVKAYNTIFEATNKAAQSDSSYAKIADVNVITVGQKLCIPGSAEAAASDKAAEAPVMAEGPTIVDIAVNDGRFTTLVKALQAANLVDTLKGPGPFTVFAPTDDAFAKLPQTDLNGLLADTASLSKVLLYHVVKGKVLAGDVVKLAAANTVEGAPINISIVDGKRVFLNNNAEVIITDIQASNGVIHVIDNVLFPPADGAMMPAAPKDIVDTAVADGRFSTLATALTAAGLIDTLKGPGPFTVFAPTDDAFAKLPDGTLDKLLANKEALTKVLTYHVVPGKVMAADVVKLNSAATVEGSTVAIKTEGDKVMVGDAQVILPDVETSNGVIHVIDTVLLPPAN